MTPGSNCVLILVGRPRRKRIRQLTAQLYRNLPAKENEMMKTREKTRIPRSVRKHIRRRKAALRRELPPAEAKRAIERLIREVRG